MRRIAVFLAFLMAIAQTAQAQNIRLFEETTEVGRIRELKIVGDAATATASGVVGTLTFTAPADHGGLTGLADDDHTQYRLESADHSHQTTGIEAGQIDHGLALLGLSDDDHTQYGQLSDAETISGNWINTANPWADNEVVDTITASNYLPLAGGTLTGDLFTANATGIVIGHNAQINFGAVSEFQVLGTGTPDSSMGFARFQANSAGPDIRFLKSRGTTIGANILVQDGDFLGRFRFQAADGGDFNTTGAQVHAEIDGSPGANDMPTSLVFSTTADNAASVTERMRIAPDGTVTIVGTLAVNGDLITSDGVLVIDATSTTSFNDEGITNVGNIALDSLSSDAGTFISVADETGFVVGHTAQITSAVVQELQVLGTTGADSRVLLGRWSIDASPPSYDFLKSRNATIGSHTILLDNDIIGSLKYYPDDGADFATLSAEFRTEVDDDSPAAGDIGTAFAWLQMPGVGGALAETMRLSAAGVLNVVGSITEAGNAVFNSTEVPGGELGNTWASPTVDATHSGSAHHSLVTLAGTPNYLTLSGQEITLAKLDITDDTNLVAGTNITLSTNTINVDDAFLLNNGDIGTGVYDFGGADSFEIVNSATPTTDVTGEIALDITITDHQPLWQYFDGGENMTLIAIDTAQLPALDNEIIKYDAAINKFVLEADAGGGSSPWQTTSNVANLVTSGDQVTIGSATSLAKLAVDGDANEIQLLAQGHSTQIANLFELQNSSATKMVTVSGIGMTAFRNTADSLTAFQINDTDGGIPIFNVDTTNERVGLGTATPDEKLHIEGAVDGIFTALLIENSQAAAGSSTNERAEIKFGFGGNNDVARITADKLNDYTSGANEDSRLAFWVDSDGTLTEVAHFMPDGLMLLLGDSRIRFAGTAGGGGQSIQYKALSGSNRAAFLFPGNDIVALINRAVDGVVEIRANTSTGGNAGEVIVATFEDDEIRLLENGGNFGLGTATPLVGFHATGLVEGTGDLKDIVALFQGATGGTQTGYLFTSDDATGDVWLALRGLPADANQWMIGARFFSGDTFAIGYGSKDVDMTFPLGTGAKFVIEAGGDVGIGDTSPDSPLEVLSTTDPQLRITHTDGVDDATFGVDSNGDLKILASGGDISFGDETLTTTGVITAVGFTIGAAVIAEAELEILDGATLTTTELNHVDGVTSSIQTQIDAQEAELDDSAGLLAALSDETGTGLAVFGTSPTLVTPALGTPSALVLTNATGLPVTGLANGTDGELITWSSTGVAETVAVGTATHVLTSNGVGVAPTFQAAAGGGGANTLDAAYDQGGAGSGRTIDADSGSVSITVSNTDNNETLTVTQNDTTNNPVNAAFVNAGTGNNVFLNQDGNGIALNIDSEATSADLISMDGTLLSTGDAIQIKVDNTMTSGKAIRVLGGASGTTEVFNVDEDGNTGIGVATPNEKLQVDDSIAISSDAEGSTARLTLRTAHETHTLSLAGTSDTTTISIPSGAVIIGCSMNVNTTVTDDGGMDESWDAMFITGGFNQIVFGAAAAQNTKVDILFHDSLEIASDTVEIQFNPSDFSTFTGGVIEIVVYYQELTSLANS